MVHVIKVCLIQVPGSPRGGPKKSGDAEHLPDTERRVECRDAEEGGLMRRHCKLGSFQSLGRNSLIHPRPSSERWRRCKLQHKAKEMHTGVVSYHGRSAFTFPAQYWKKNQIMCMCPIVLLFIFIMPTHSSQTTAQTPRVDLVAVPALIFYYYSVANTHVIQRFLGRIVFHISRPPSWHLYCCERSNVYPESSHLLSDAQPPGNDSWGTYSFLDAARPWCACS